MAFRDPSLRETDPAKFVSSIVTDLHSKGRKATVRDVVVASQARGLALSNAAAENALAIAVKECLLVSLQKGRVFEPAPPKHQAAALDENVGELNLSAITSKVESHYVNLADLYQVTGVSPPMVPPPQSARRRTHDDDDDQDDVVDDDGDVEDSDDSDELSSIRDQAREVSMDDLRSIAAASGSAPSSPAPMRTPVMARQSPLMQRASDQAIKYPLSKRVITAHLKVEVLKLFNCDATLEGRQVFVQWQWGSKSVNRGESERCLVSNGQAWIMYEFAVTTEFVQETKTMRMEENCMALTLMALKPDGQREQVAMRSLDMTDFSADQVEKQKNFALNKKETPMKVELRVTAYWRKINGQPVKARAADTTDVAPATPDRSSIASPTQLPSQIAPRLDHSRSAVKSPVAIQAAMMKDPRNKDQVLEMMRTTPKATVERMLASTDKHHLQSLRGSGSTTPTPAAPAAAAATSPVPTTPVAPKDDSPRGKLRFLQVSPRSPAGRKGSPITAAAVSTASASPFFRKNTDKIRKARDEAKPETPVFGVPLDRVMEQQRETHPDLAVPYLVHHLCGKVFELNGQKEEGIFRLSIPSDDLPKFMGQMDRGNYALPPKDPHYPAVLLKRFLTHLPEPVCPDYARCLGVIRGGNHASDVAALFHSLPTHNQELLKYLAAFIAKLIPHAGATKMELVQFCTVFKPALVRNPQAPADIVTAMKSNEEEQEFVAQLLQWLMVEASTDAPRPATPTPVRAANASGSMCAACGDRLEAGVDCVRIKGRMWHGDCAPAQPPTPPSGSGGQFRKRKSEEDDIMGSTPDGMKGIKTSEHASPHASSPAQKRIQ